MADRRTQRRSTTEEDPRIRAEALHSDGMPYQMAMAVAQGKLSLSEAMDKMAQKLEAEKIERDHGIGKALATQIAMGQLELDDVLRRRRLAEHREKQRDRTVLEVGQNLIIGVHGARTVRGTVKVADAYSVTIDESGSDVEVHKLQIKYAHDAADWKRVKKGLRIDRDVAEKGIEPIVLPQERYGCSDKRLFNYLDNRIDLQVVLLEGESLKGQVAWFSRYEFGLKLRSGAEVGIFRHALYRVTS